MKRCPGTRTVREPGRQRVPVRAEKLVTILNGMPSVSRRGEGLGRPRKELALEDDHTIRVEHQPANAGEGSDRSVIAPC